MITDTDYFVQCNGKGEITTTANEFIQYLSESIQEKLALNYLECIIRNEYLLQIDELKDKLQQYDYIITKIERHTHCKFER